MSESTTQLLSKLPPLNDALGESRRARRAYVVALGLLALLTVCGLVVVQETMDGQDRAAQILNLAGRQRMLSQRMLLTALQIEGAREGRRELLLGTLASDRAIWRENHHRLLSGDLSAFAAASERGAIRELEHAFRALEGVLAEVSDGAEAGPVAVDAGERYLALMDTAVFAHSREVARRVRTTRIVEVALGLATLLLLALEAVLLFWPLAARLERSLQRQARLTDALLLSQARYDRAITAVREGVWDWDGKAQLYWSPRFFELGGVDPAEGARWDLLEERVVEGDRARLRAALQAEERVDVELRVEGPTGPRWRHLRGRRAADGRLSGTLADVDQRRRLEAERERLHQTLEEDLRLARERLSTAELRSALGSLAAGMAHDFNNYLQVIRTAADALMERGAERAPVEAIAQAAAEAGNLAGQLLALGRDRAETASSIPVDLGSLVEAFAPLVRRSLPPGVHLSLEIDPDLPTVLGDPAQLRQAILNTALNARDAMPEGGALIVAVRRRPREGTGGVELTVQDEGVGMEPEVQARVLEPFFTTKVAGKGSGLGLAVVDAIVQRHGGGLRIESAPGCGTLVRLWLPAASAEGQDALAVLVVEDDPALLRGLQRSLERRGHQVRGATGYDALENDSRPDVVVCDVMLGDRQGPAVVEDLRARWGEALPVVFTSGYSGVQVDLSGPTTAFLRKPFAQRDLDDAIRRVVEAASPTGG